MRAYVDCGGWQNTFSGEGYAGLSDNALYFVGGIIKHGKESVECDYNPSANSYKRWFQVLKRLSCWLYSARNRSASIRIHTSLVQSARRIEARFLIRRQTLLGFAALLMALV